MKYVCLLRGINVGGKNKVPMPELKRCFEQAGYVNVSTYINSGNVIFESAERDAAEMVAACESFIEARFGFAPRLAVISEQELDSALAKRPEWWGRDPASKHNAIFVIAPATAEEVMTAVGVAKPEYEKAEYRGNVIFWSAPIKTFSRTRWLRIVGTAAYKDVTIRNHNTTLKLHKLMQ